MGRWRGNKRRPFKKDGFTSTNGGAEEAGSSNGNNGGNVLWSWKEQKEVIAYLTEYRKAAERLYQSGAGHGNSGTTANATDDNADKAPVVIGGIVFPALTDTAVSQPYLTLSKALSSKQRKAMHEFSVDGTYATYKCTRAY